MLGLPAHRLFPAQARRPHSRPLPQREPADELARGDEHLREETGLPVSIAEDPLSCVAIGTGRAMEDPVYRGVLMTA